MQDNLVILKKDEVFTTSEILATGTGVEHRKLKVLVVDVKNVA